MVADVWRGPLVKVTAGTVWFAMLRGLVIAFLVGIPMALMAAEPQGDVDTRPVITSINARQLATVLQKAGFAAEFDEEDEEGNVVDLSIDGYHAVGFVWDDGTRIEFYGGFSDQTLTPEVINAWAASDLLSRVSISESGSAGVKADLYLEPGVTREIIIFYCRAFYSDFREFVGVTIPLDGPDDDPFMDSTEDPFGTAAGPQMEDPFGADPFGADPFGADPFGAPGNADPGPDPFDAGPESPSPPNGDGLFDDPFGDAPSASGGGAP